MDTRKAHEQFRSIKTAIEAEKARIAALQYTKPEPSVTNKKRRAAGWESENKDKVREQTNARVKKHRATHQDQYREYMKEYMRRRRQSKGE